MLEHAANRRSARLTSDTITFVDAHATIRCLRDQIVVEPLDVTYSRRLIVPQHGRPVRGIVKAVGPGHYPTAYLDADGDRLPDHSRSKRRRAAGGVQFVPTSVKVGDIVAVGDYAFETFWHGDKLRFLCREQDVCGVEDGNG